MKSSRGTFETCDEHDETLTIVVSYMIHPGEPLVMYDRDGGGYPGSPPECEFQVTRDGKPIELSKEAYKLIREECFEHAKDEEENALADRYDSMRERDRDGFTDEERHADSRNQQRNEL